MNSIIEQGVDIGHININTAVVGFYSLDKQDKICKGIIKSLLDRLRRITGTNSIYMTYENEIVIVSISRHKIEDDNNMRLPENWVRKHKRDYQDIYMAIGFDRRLMDLTSSMTNSISMARFYMYKELVKDIPYRHWDAERVKEFINSIKHILNNLVVTGAMHESKEAYQVSVYIDSLHNEYIRRS